MDDSPTCTYRLFKYRSIGGQNRYYTERIITHGRIYYAAPKQFHDLFDCLFCVNMDSAPLNAFGLSKRDEIKAFSENWLREKTNKNFPSAHALVRDFREIAQNRKRLSGAIEARGR